MRFRLQDVVDAVGGRLEVGDGQEGVDGVSIDSRTTEAGNLFVPLVAERDGHDFIDKALAAGAAAYFCSGDFGSAHPAGLDAESAATSVPRIRVDDTAAALTAVGRLARSRLSAQVIGITGSVGKTSVKDLTRAACTGSGDDPVVWASARSFNNEIGVPLTLANAPDDTDILIAEMGARGIGHIAELCSMVRPTVGVVTAVALVHSELFGSIEAVAEAKGELIEALPSDGTAVLNADNPLVAAMADRTDAQVITFGQGLDADMRVSNVVLDPSLRPVFDLIYRGETKQITVPVAGAHMAVNAGAAVAAAVAAGVRFDQAAAQVSAVALSPWRMEVTTTESGVIVINDAYNANPTSMRAALDALAGTGAAARVAVVGEMAELGEEGPAEHRAISARAAAAGIRVIAVACPAYGPDVIHVDDIDAALAALGSLGADSAVLVKGSRVTGLERLADRLIAAM